MTDLERSERDDAHFYRGLLVGGGATALIGMFMLASANKNFDERVENLAEKTRIITTDTLYTKDGQEAGVKLDTTYVLTPKDLNTLKR